VGTPEMGRFLREQYDQQAKFYQSTASQTSQQWRELSNWFSEQDTSWPF